MLLRLDVVMMVRMRMVVMHLHWSMAIGIRSCYRRVVVRVRSMSASPMMSRMGMSVHMAMPIQTLLVMWMSVSILVVV